MDLCAKSSCTAAFLLNISITFDRFLFLIVMYLVLGEIYRVGFLSERLHFRVNIVINLIKLGFNNFAF